MTHARSKLLLLVAAVAWVAPAPEGDVAPAGAEVEVEAGHTDAATVSIQDVRLESTEAGRRVVVQLGRAPERLRSFAVDDPPRLVMDVWGPRARDDGRELRFPLDDALVQRVRAAAYRDRLRIVVDLREGIPVRTARVDGSALVAELRSAPAAAEIGAIAAASGSAEAATPVAVAPEPAAPAPVAPTAAAEPTPASEPTPAIPPSKEVARTEPEPPATSAEEHAATAMVVAKPAPMLADAPVLLAATTPPRSRPAGARRPSAAVPPGAPRVYSGERISLDFKDADIQNVLRVLADASQLNIIATDDVKGKVTLHLSDVPWDQALDLVLRTNRLEATYEGNVVRVSTVERLKEEREALRAAEEAQRELEPLRVAYQRVSYARADEALIDKVKGVLTDRGSVTFDDRTNTIVIRDIQRGISDAQQLIRELDVQSPQVLIEANIVEATEDFARGLGVQWGYRYSGGPQTGTPTGANFPGSIGIGGAGLGSTLVPGTGTGAAPSPVPFLADFPVPSGFGSGFGPGSGSALDLAVGWAFADDPESFLQESHCSRRCLAMNGGRPPARPVRPSDLVRAPSGILISMRKDRAAVLIPYSDEYLRKQQPKQAFKHPRIGAYFAIRLTFENGWKVETAGLWNTVLDRAFFGATADAIEE